MWGNASLIEPRLLVSYIPLLEPHTQAVPPSRTNEVLAMLDSAVREEFKVHGIAWVEKEGVYNPTLMVNHPQEISKHLRNWADLNVSKWFTLIWDTLEDDKGYILVLTPNVDRALRRFSIKGKMIFHTWAYCCENPVPVKYLQGRQTAWFGFCEFAVKVTPDDIKSVEYFRVPLVRYSSLPEGLYKNAVRQYFEVQ